MIPHTFSLIVISFIMIMYFKFGANFLEMIEDPYGQTLALIVLLTSFFKLISMIGYDIFMKWANGFVEVLTK